MSALNKYIGIIIILIMIFMTGCELEKYEIGEVIDDNYYNKYSAFKIELSKDYKLVQDEDRLKNKVHNILAVLGTEDSFKYEYAVSDGDTSMYIYSEENINDMSVVGISEIIKENWNKQDMECTDEEDIYVNEVRFRCLKAASDNVYEAFYITVVGNDNIYVYIQSDEDKNIDGAINMVSAYYP